MRPCACRLRIDHAAQTASPHRRLAAFSITGRLSQPDAGGRKRKQERMALRPVSAAALLLPAVPAQTDPIEDFYRGKTLRMLIGYGPGGGYDSTAGWSAEFLPLFPGQSR